QLDTLAKVDDLSAMLQAVGGACVRLSDAPLSVVVGSGPVSLPASHFLERASVPLLEPIQVLENVPRRVRSVLQRFPDGSELASSALNIVAVTCGHRCLLACEDCVP